MPASRSVLAWKEAPDETVAEQHQMADSCLRLDRFEDLKPGGWLEQLLLRWWWGPGIWRSGA